MNIDTYQREALTTAIYPETYKVMYPAFGLAGETGEVMNKLKKIIRDGDGDLTHENKLALAAELGDVLWYLAALASDLGLNLSFIAGNNLEKLAQRKVRGTLKGSGDKR